MLPRLRMLGTGVVALTMYSLAAATLVTFQVDMSVQQLLGNFDPATQTVAVRGEFNAWGAGDVLADADQDTIYTITLDIAESLESYEYKFCILPQEVWETLPANREVVVGADPLILPVVYFSD